MYTPYEGKFTGGKNDSDFSANSSGHSHRHRHCHIHVWAYCGVCQVRYCTVPGCFREERTGYSYPWRPYYPYQLYVPYWQVDEVQTNSQGSICGGHNV